MIKILILAIAAYVLGSIPFGVVSAKTKGIDLTKTGSGNIGATNALRALGKGPAIITLLGDMLKGTAAVAIARLFEIDPLYEGIIGLAAILGHSFSLFLNFRGGKGVATSIGVLLIYSPQTAILTLAIWLAVLLLTRISSLSALVAFALLPINIILFDNENIKLFVTVLIVILIFAKHIGNIKRIVKGKEKKIGERA
ncbi:MAG: glycerol-3-phosphate 1-O-acyltransferase PlsY [Nitrospiraceae bacterium]|nr:glycerol-3-phosphate 1-O-acyltransferase PlsY [Nitrospiraceae bacterium]